MGSATVGGMEHQHGMRIDGRTRTVSTDEMPTVIDPLTGYKCHLLFYEGEPDHPDIYIVGTSEETPRLPAGDDAESLRVRVMDVYRAGQET